MPRGRPPGVPLPPVLKAELRAFCDMHSQWKAYQMIGISPRTLYKALNGDGLDAKTHERIALALGRDSKEFEPLRREAEDLYKRTVEQLRAGGHALDSARRIARAAFLSCVL